jgi:phosphatidylglycerophosphate synthase
VTPRRRGLFGRSRKAAPTQELLCEYMYRPLAHLVVLALLPLRVPPPAVVLAAGATGIAAAVELALGNLWLAAVLLVLKTVLDNADGQLARASGRVTAFGRYLDSESDLVVNLALCVALGYATHDPLLGLVCFLLLTLLGSVNFNLRRLYELERGRASEAMPAATGAGGVVRAIYGFVYAPQDRAIERFVAWRLRNRRSANARLRYHDRTTIAWLHNLGLSTQMTALAACLAVGRPQLELWVVLAGGLSLVVLELRRGLRGGGAEKASTGAPSPAHT